ncbi:carbohydrate ABC transporter permease [Clostridium sediminicola]|uniref:carbohydrate ABC transporter permease n=1 Tax=Clostridium sediminicola TaxID=3114879 RepID=UPI0031F20914
MKKNSKISILRVVLLIMFFIFMFTPILWMFLTSLKPVDEIVTVPLKYLPTKITFSNYQKLWKATDFPIYFKNSMVVSMSCAFFTTMVSIFAGYSMSRFKFKGKQITLLVFLATQMIPIVVIIIPLFIVFAKINLFDTLIGLILIYIVLNIPFCTMLIKGFFERIPIALEESAMIDGCSRVESLFKIILPVMLPGMVAAFVFAFIGAWNDLFFSIMFINSEAIKTIPVGINTFIGKYEIDWGTMSAATILALIPVFIMFAMIQKYLVQGLTSGAVKG